MQQKVYYCYTKMCHYYHKTVLYTKDNKKNNNKESVYTRTYVRVIFSRCDSEAYITGLKMLLIARLYCFLSL